MGIAVNGQCYADAAAAAVAVCASYPRESITDSGSLVSYRCTGSSGAVLELTRDDRDPSGSLFTSTVSVPVLGPACDAAEHVQDTFALWFLLLGLCAAIWAGKRVYALFIDVRGES